MNKTSRTAAAALFFTAIRTSAHHSFAAEYDVNKLVTVSGIVAKFEWMNPHALLYVDGRDAAGKAGSWKFEMGSPGGLESRGWKRTDLRDGYQITVDGYAAKDGSSMANARTVTLPGRPEAVRGLSGHPW